MLENFAITMNKKINPESNSEKFENSEIKKEELDLTTESKDTVEKARNDLVKNSPLKPKLKIETKDYFLDELKESNRLGYKGTLDLLIRSELNILEREVAKVLGANVDEIRNQFLNYKRQSSTTKEILNIIPVLFIMNDYRAFLINTISVFRLKKLNRNRY